MLLPPSGQIFLWHTKTRRSVCVRACVCVRAYVCARAHAPSLQSCLCVTPWTVSCQGPLSMGFSRQEYWSGLLFPPPGASFWPKDRPQVSRVPEFAGGLFTSIPPVKPQDRPKHSAFLFLGGSDGKKICLQCGRPRFGPGLGRSPGEGNGNPLQDSCLENPMDRGAWRGTVHGVAKESDMTEWLTHTHEHSKCPTAK